MCIVLSSPSLWCGIFPSQEFQGLLYDLMKQAVLGGLEVDEVILFLNELMDTLVSEVFGSERERERERERENSR